MEFKILGTTISIGKSPIITPVEDVETRSLTSPLSFGGVATATGYGDTAAALALKLSAVYRAVNLISNGVGSLQMKLYDIDADGYKTEDRFNPLANILGVEPNAQMGRYMFFKMLEIYKLNRGNGYAFIERNSRYMPVALTLLNPDMVFPIMLDGQLKYICTQLGKTVDASDIIHVMNFPILTTNGFLIGVSTITYAAGAIQTTTYADKSARENFRTGGAIGGVLNAVTTMDKKQREAMTNDLRDQTSMDKIDPNSVHIIAGPELKMVPFGITPKDSQHLESRAFNITEIARYYSVNPLLLFAHESKLASAENAQLDFLNTTLVPELDLIENEFTRKLILPSQRPTKEIKFDVAPLLRADSAARGTFFNTMFNIGVLSPNDIAREMNYPKIAGGDKHFVPVNVQDIENLIYDKTNPAPTSIPIDNKLK